jgi:predicted O-methyltransferase YrrM
VEVERFLRELPGLFDDFPGSELPRDGRFAEILEAVPGLGRANNLALLNLAARCLEPGECYVEVGTYRGTSLIAAMLGNEEHDFVALDNWSLGDGSREQLDANLGRYGLDGKPSLIEGDAHETLRSGALAGRRVGVYYYDDGHEFEQQLDGLRLIEPYLASPALVLVDDSDWERVAAAIAAYLDEAPRAEQVLGLEGVDHGRAWWWEGITAIAWDRNR